MSTVAPSFAHRLKQARLACGLSQVELARRAGTEQSEISVLEREAVDVGPRAWWRWPTRSTSHSTGSPGDQTTEVPLRPRGRDGAASPRASSTGATRGRSRSREGSRGNS